MLLSLPMANYLSPEELIVFSHVPGKATEGFIKRYFRLISGREPEKILDNIYKSLGEDSLTETACSKEGINARKT
jgi:hypothetical protein